MVTRYENLSGANLLKGGTMSGVKIRVSADTSQARTELQKLEKSVGKIESATSRLGSSIKAAVATYSTFFSTAAVVKVADQFQSLENQLKIVQKEGESVAGTFSKLNRLSISSRTTLRDTVTNYTRLSRALEKTNLSQQDYLDVTEAINKATKIGGQPLATQQAALFQLSQAFSSGVLRGEEFNSVSEGAPEILRALTESLGVTRKELREMAFYGQITSDVLVNSLLSALPDIQREFETLTPLVGELSQIMGQEFNRALRELDKITGISASVGDKLQLLTLAFSFFADNAQFYFNNAKLSVLQFRRDIRDSFDAIQLLISGLFSDTFSVEKFKANFQEAKNAVTEFFSNLDFSKLKETKETLSGFFSTEYNMEAFNAGFSTFKTNITELFSSIDNEKLNNFKNTLSGFFSENFSTENFKTNLGTAKTAITDFFSKDIFTVEEDSFLGKLMAGTPLFSVDNIIEGTSEALKKIKEFASSVIDTFFNILDEVILNSSWSGLFWKGADRIGGPKLEKGLREALSKIEGWADSIIGYFETIKDSSFEFFSEAFNGSALESSLDASSNKIDSWAESIKNSYGGLGELLFGKEIQLPGENGTIRQGGLKQSLVDSGETAKALADAIGSFVVENKWALAGTAIATATLSVMNAELRSNLFQGLFLGLGYVIGAGALSILTSPIGLTVGAIVFGPGLLNAANESGLTRELGRKISEGLVTFFETDSEGKSTFQRVISAIVNTASELGAGIFEGLDLSDSFVTALIGKDLTSTLSGALALAFTTIAITGILKNGIFGAGYKIVTALFKYLATGASLASALGLAADAAGDDGGVNSRFGKLGKTVGKLFKGGFQAAAAGFIVESLSDALASRDGVLTETEEQLGNVGGMTARGAVAGATIGSMVPVVGTAIGGAVGAAGGLIAGLFLNPEADAAIGQFVHGLHDKLVESLKELWAAGGELASAAGNWAVTLATDLGNSIYDYVVSGLTDAWNKVKGLFNFGDDDTGSNTKGRSLSVSQYGIDNPLIRQEDMVRRASGGYISGPGGPKSDLIPAMLSNGEFVIQASAVNKFGTGFLSAINSGNLPGFANGSGTSAQEERFLLQLAQRERDLKRYKQEQFNNEVADTPDPLLAQQITTTEADIARIKAALSGFDYGEFGSIDTSGSSGGNGPESGLDGPGAGDQEKSIGRQYAERFRDDFQFGLSEALKTGDFKEFGKTLLDSFTSNVIDSFSQGLTDKLFSGLLGEDGKDGPLSKIFGGTFNLGEKGGDKETAKTIGDTLSETLGGEGGIFSGLKEMFSGLPDMLGGLFKGISGLFGGGGGGLDFGGLLTAGLGFFGFSEGGLVPRISGSVSGRDSVPAMLTPGELVVPKNNIDDFMKNTDRKESTVQSFNINVQGDVSRQTRKEIVKMMPEISLGVNKNNRENNVRR